MYRYMIFFTLLAMTAPSMADASNDQQPSLSGLWSGSCQTEAGSEPAGLTLRINENNIQYSDSSEHNGEFLFRAENEVDGNVEERISILLNHKTSGAHLRTDGYVKPVFATIESDQILTTGNIDFASMELSFKPRFDIVKKRVNNGKRTAWGIHGIEKCAAIVFARQNSDAATERITGWITEASFPKNKLDSRWGTFRVPGDMTKRAHGFVFASQGLETHISPHRSSIAARASEPCVIEKCETAQQRAANAVYDSLPKVRDSLVMGKGVGPSLVESRPGEMIASADEIDNLRRIVIKLSMGDFDFSVATAERQSASTLITQYCFAIHENPATRHVNRTLLCDREFLPAIADVLATERREAVKFCHPKANKPKFTRGGVPPTSYADPHYQNGDNRAYFQCMRQNALLPRLDATLRFTHAAQHYREQYEALQPMYACLDKGHCPMAEIYDSVEHYKALLREERLPKQLERFAQTRREISNMISYFEE